MYKEAETKQRFGLETLKDLVVELKCDVRTNGRAHRLSFEIERRYLRFCNLSSIYAAYNCLNHNMYYDHACKYKIDVVVSHSIRIMKSDLHRWLQERCK